MSGFGNIISDDSISTVEEDTTGPSYIVDSGVYDAVIDMAYVLNSKSSNAKGLLIKLKLRDGSTVENRIWFTNKNGQTFYTRDGQKYNLPGFNQLNSLSAVAADSKFLDLGDTIQEKDVLIWNSEQKKELPTPTQVVTGLIGKPVKAGILRTYQDVGDKDNDWAPSGFSREENVIDRFFDANSGQTHQEKVNGSSADYIGKWNARNEGITRDQTKNKIGLKVKPKDSTPAVASSNEAKPSESLFGADDASSDVPF